jgi:excisionase family DNA binding protein
MPELVEPMLLSIPQTCQALGLSRSKTYELISEGRLLAIRIGRRRLVRVDSVKALAQGEAA